MITNKAFIQTLGAFVCMFVAFFVLVQMAAAVDDGTVPTRGLTLSPIRAELDITPGTLLEHSLKVVNHSNKAITVHMSAEKFSVINQQYDYAFTAESDTAKWVTFASDEVQLAPGKSQQIAYKIGVPLTAEPGGRYISLFASTDTTVGDGSVQSRQRIGSLVYLTVTGNVTRVGKLISLTSPWAIGAKDLWSMAIQNSGSTHFRSRYSVEMHHLIGGGIAASLSGDALILPGSVRAVTDVLPTPRLPGVYKTVFTIGLGDTPLTHQTRYLLFIPAWSIVALIIIISLAIILIYYIRSLRKH